MATAFKIYWASHNIALISAFILTIAYWTFLYDGEWNSLKFKQKCESSYDRVTRFTWYRFCETQRSKSGPVRTRFGHFQNCMWFRIYGFRIKTFNFGRKFEFGNSGTKNLFGCFWPGTPRSKVSWNSESTRTKPEPVPIWTSGETLWILCDTVVVCFTEALKLNFAYRIEFL